jgi:hypothetical protein
VLHALIVALALGQADDAALGQVLGRAQAYVR